MNKIPLYVCHKKVNAFEIGKIEGTKIFPKSEELCGPVDVGSDFIDKHKNKLNEGGYLVIYKDGYKSWSPKKAFDEGYTLTA